jgi:3',5'-cyclic-AMP phosphodiesterase
MHRRDFIKRASAAILVLGNGSILTLADSTRGIPGKKPILRFAVASDGHYGQKDTEYEKFFAEIVNNINQSHQDHAFDFCVINGDIVHDDKTFYPAVKKALDNLLPRYYVSQGNHDRVTATEWTEIWKMPVNIDFTIRKNAILIGTTSNEKGTYLCPDLDWFAQKLDEYKKKKNIFIFIHINPGKQTKHAVDCPAFFELLSNHKNVKAVFNGHDHDEDNIKMKNDVPFIFDAHFGGNWGTSYRGYRIVELYKDNSLLTYVLNPTDKLNEQIL